MNQWANNYYTKQDNSYASTKAHPVAPKNDVRRKNYPIVTLPHTNQKKAGNGAGTEDRWRVTDRGEGRDEGRGNREAFLWVFRVVHMTSDTLRSFMERRGIKVMSVDEVSHKGAAYRAFLVSVIEDDMERVLQRDFWPGLVASRRWQEGDQRKGGHLSRRSARSARANHRPAPTSPSVRAVAEQGKIRPSSPPKERRNVARRYGAKENNMELKGRRGSVNGNDVKGRRGSEGKESKGRKGSDIKEKGRKGSEVMKETKGRRGSDKEIKTEKKADNTRRKKSASELEKKPDKSRKKKPVRARKVSSRKSSLTDKTEKSIKRTYKNVDRVNKKSKRGKPLTTSKHMEQRKQKPKQAWSDPETDKKILQRKSNKISSINLYEGDDGKNKHRELKYSDRKKSLTLIDIEGTASNKVFYEDMNIIDRSIRKRPYTKNTSPTRKIGPKGLEHGIDVEQTSLSNEIYVKEPQTPQKRTQTNENYPDWSASLKYLLTRSSDEALDKLLGPDYDRLLGQEDISEEELFLGIEVLAHCSQAKNSNPIDLQNLVYKIWQPRIINLFKTFSVTVERKYPERGERYFWNMAEFLDLYIEGKREIEGMSSLLTTCHSEVMALNYRRYVTPDLVKVYKGMQARYK